MKCVVDASVLACLLLPDETTEQVDAWVGNLTPGEARAPQVLQLEVTNVLLIAHRRKRISGQELRQLSEAFELLDISYEPLLSAVEREAIVHLAEKHNLTAYDAAYLELATRSGLPIASLDGTLVKAAKAEGVKRAL